jgi:UDP-3-O-[3-hydroxymyristoyl] glucosamine N-acyltransferase
MKLINNKNKTGTNVTIYENVKIGKNVTIGDNCIIYDNVVIGDGTFVGPFCTLGEPLKDYYSLKDYSNPPLHVGRHSIIRSGSIFYAGSELGDYLETGHRVTIRENSKIGAHCKIGTLSDIQG